MASEAIDQPSSRLDAPRDASRDHDLERQRRRRKLGVLVAGIVVVWLGLLQFFAHRYGVQGPLELFGRDLVFGPKRGRVIWASLLMSCVALRGRERLTVFGIAAGIDLVFFLGRLPFDTRLTYGNGPLWTMFGLAIWAWYRTDGERRANILKGVGLGLALVVGTKASDTYLNITVATRPEVLDQYVQTADHALGNLSWFFGRLMDASGPIVELIIQTIYIELPVAAMLLAIWQIRKGWPRHTFVRTFLLIAAIGPAFYLLFPVVGPIFAYGELGGRFAVQDVWPNHLPFHTAPHAFRFDSITPRNCMPSLHTAWSFAIFIHTRREIRAIRWAGVVWFVGTLIATLAFGWHYGVDLVAGAVFTIAIESALRAPERGWYPARVALVVGSTVTLFAMLASYRYLSEPMAAHPWVAGPLLLLALAVVATAFYRQFFGPRNPWTPGGDPVEAAVAATAGEDRSTEPAGAALPSPAAGT